MCTQISLKGVSPWTPYMIKSWKERKILIQFRFHHNFTELHRWDKFLFWMHFLNIFIHRFMNGCRTKEREVEKVSLCDAIFIFFFTETKKKVVNKNFSHSFPAFVCRDFTYTKKYDYNFLSSNDTNGGVAFKKSPQIAPDSFKMATELW